MRLNDNNAVTLVEMIATMTVGTLLVFILSSFINLSNRSYAQAVQESGMNSSLIYGLKLIQNRVHKSKSLAEVSLGGQWLSERLICNDEYAFGVYQASAGASKDFVYLPDKDDTSDRQVIYSVSPDESIDFAVTISGKTAVVNITGTMNDAPFTVTGTMMRRS